MLCVSVLKCNMVSKNCHNYGEMPSICTYTRRTERRARRLFRGGSWRIELGQGYQDP